MLGLTTALIGMFLVLVAVTLMVAVAFIMTTIERFQMWILRKITSPSGPPWKQYHIGLNHVRTSAVTDIIKIRKLVLPIYKTAL